MSHSSLLKKPVFAVTNLGTRIAIAVSQDSTVRDFKKEFEMAHLNCFPELGKIRVHGLKVMRKSFFYDLSESFLLKHAFQDAKGWFLHVAVCQAQDHSATEKKGKRFNRKRSKMKKFTCFRTAFLEVPRSIYFLKRKKKCNRVRKNTTAKCPLSRLEQGHLSSQEMVHFASVADGKWGSRGNLRPAIECPSETVSETMSVSGIISKYFSSYDEVTSNSTFSVMELHKENKEHVKAEIASILEAKTPPEVHFQSFPESSSRALRITTKEDVGTRLLEASINLGLSSSRQNPALSLSRLPKSADTPIRRLIFEITDEDD